jgi:hypothetical protein
MKKESKSFLVFGMQKERKYFPERRENRGEIKKKTYESLVLS